MRNRHPDKLTWPPDWMPDVILSPGEEPEFTLEEICDLTDDEFAVEYYRRSGRYLGVFESRQEADKADKYFYLRVLLPGGHLPWEQSKEEENKNE